jgi:hypothetical protein
LWENRKLGLPTDQQWSTFTDADGVDCRTTKQGKSRKAFHGYKFKTSGLRYTVATSIFEADIVHIDGPHPPGDWNDLQTFREYLKPWLDPGERIVAEDPATIIAANGIRGPEPEEFKTIRKYLRNRHETCNSRLKQFGILSGTFRHDILKHGACFRACAVLTQLSFEFGGKKLYDMDEMLRSAGGV